MSLKHTLKILYLKKIRKQDDSRIMIDHLRKIGMKIGKNVCLCSDIETNEPYLIEIGDDVIIAGNVMLLTHDASAKYYIPGASDIFGRVKIGSHTFIGAGTVVLPGGVIADHCIVGAGSVVTKKFTTPGMVIAGSPAKEICSVDELREKNEKYCLNTWGKSFEEKKEYLLKNEHKFKGYEASQD